MHSLKNSKNMDQKKEIDIKNKKKKCKNYLMNKNHNISRYINVMDIVMKPKFQIYLVQLLTGFQEKQFNMNDKLITYFIYVIFQFIIF